MDNKQKLKTTFIWLMLIAFAISLCMLAGCRAKDGTEIKTYDQFNESGISVGVGLNCPEEYLLEEEYPKLNVIQYYDTKLGYKDVANGRLDAFVYSRRQMELAIQEGTSGVRLLDENYTTNKVAIGISPVTKIPDFENKLNTFISEIKKDGTLDDMYNRWVLQGDETMPDIDPPENPKYSIRVATAGTEPPYTYYSGSELNGFDIEMARRFAAWMGAGLELKVIDFGGILAAAKSGDVDCIMSDLYYTNERAESITFSDILFEVEITAMVRDRNAESQTGFRESVKNSFKKTFVREERWRLFLSGIGTTLLVTLMSILFGSLLGFIAFMLCRNGNPIANRITGFCVWLVQGMPAVVLLMILYYIVFQSFALTGTMVAIIGFTLVFGSGVFTDLMTAVGAIDRGQLEAAYALGYTNRKAFFKIILPQAMPHFMPAYRGEITGLIKATAIVGYIAVQDITKMGDIVRSRTYEAFFPLIAVAVIYFILAAVMIAVVNRIEPKLDPRLRTPDKIRKEVEGK